MTSPSIFQTFFEQIEKCIEQGMKPEEIGYQQAFNKQELRKAVAAYPVKEVRQLLCIVSNFRFEEASSKIFDIDYSLNVAGLQRIGQSVQESAKTLI